MGRTNLIILAFGVAGCLLLAFAMRRSASLAVPHAALVRAVQHELGARLDGPVRVRRDGATLRVDAAVLRAAARRGVARDVGARVWRELQRARQDAAEGARGVERVEVRCRVDDGLVAGFAVPPPWRPRASLEPLAPRTPAAAPR